MKETEYTEDPKNTAEYGTCHAAFVMRIAVASVHGMDYLVSWNCTHIANATMRGRIEAICRGAGFEPPVICTPIELVKEQAP